MTALLHLTPEHSDVVEQVLSFAGGSSTCLLCLCCVTFYNMFLLLRPAGSGLCKLDCQRTIVASGCALRRLLLRAAALLLPGFCSGMAGALILFARPHSAQPPVACSS